MRYHSAQPDDCLSYLILRGKKKKKKQNTPEYKVSPHFQWSGQKSALVVASLISKTAVLPY